MQRDVDALCDAENKLALATDRVQTRVLDVRDRWDAIRDGTVELKQRLSTLRAAPQPDRDFWVGFTLHAKLIA